MSKPKRHHFVAQMIQKRFVDADGKVWAYDCRTPGRGLFQEKPSGFMLQGHLYSEVAEDGKADTSLETDFAKLESAADPIVERMVVGARKGKLPNFDQRETNIWIEFFIQQIRRVPDNFDGLITIERMREVLDIEIPRLRSEGHKISAEAETAFRGEDNLKRQIQNIRILNLRGWGAWLKLAERNRSFSLAYIPNPKKSFILSSSPVGRLLPGVFTESKPGVMQNWFPIAPDVACAVHGQEFQSKLIEVGTVKVRALNEALTRQSTIIASKSEELVSSLSKMVGTAKPSREMLEHVDASLTSAAG